MPSCNQVEAVYITAGAENAENTAMALDSSY